MLKFRRLIARESPFWGFLVGVASTLLMAGVALLPLIGQLENVFLDMRFKYRRPLAESPAIVHIDMDDNSIEALGPTPWPRTHHAALVRMVHQLGARFVVFDMKYARPPATPETPFQPAQERYTLRPADQKLIEAMASAGNVMVVYDFDLEQWLAKDLYDALPGMAAVLRKNAAADDRALAGAGRIPDARFAERRGTLRRAALMRAIRDARGERSFTYLELLDSMMPGVDRDPRDVALFEQAWDGVRSREALLPKAHRAMDGAGIPARESTLVTPPALEITEATIACGQTNAIHDVDGILRRPPLFVSYEGRHYPHMGLLAAAEWFERAEGWKVSLERAAGNFLHFRARDGQTIKHDVRIRLDGEGRVLVNWPGAPDRWGFSPAQRIGYARVYSAWQRRYEVLQRRLLDDVNALAEDVQAKVRAQYPAVFEASPYDAGAADFPSQQIALAELMLEQIRERIAGLKTGIERFPPEHPRRAEFQRELERNTAILGNFSALVTEVRHGEEELHRLVGGKICFVGSASTGSGDLHSTPLGRNTPGVNTLSAITNMLMMDQFLAEVSPGLNRLLAFMLGIMTAVVCSAMRPRVSMTISGLALLGYGAVAYALFSFKGVVIAVAAPSLTIAATYAAVVTYREMTEFRARRQLQNELEGQTHPEIVRMVLENPEALNATRKQVGTVMFSDLVGFTGISELMNPEELRIFINRCHELVSDHIIECKGYVDKFMGDGVMAVFGVLSDAGDQARNACTAALGSVASVEELNRDLQRQKLPRVSLRIGVNTGDLVWGRVGSGKRQNITVMGDTVNVGARFEPLNKLYRSTIIIGPDTKKQVGEEFVTRELDLIRVKGRAEPLPVHELICAAAVAGQQRMQVEAYTAALATFRNRWWQDAANAFEEYMKKFGVDGAAELYLTRAATFIDRPPPKDWDGAFDMGFK